MENASILSYQFVDLSDGSSPFLYFKNLDSTHERCKNPEECKIACLTYRRNDDSEKIRKDLQGEILNLGYRTKDELKKSIDESQKGIQENKLTSWLNPFDKNKNKKQKIGAGGMIAMHVLPFVMIPAALFTGSPSSTLLYGCGGSFIGSDILFGIARSSGASNERKNIRNLEEKFKSPENEYFCRLKEIAPKLEVENVFVDDAHLLVENMKTLDCIELKNRWEPIIKTKVEKDYRMVNSKLNKIYEDYLLQNKL